MGNNIDNEDEEVTVIYDNEDVKVTVIDDNEDEEVTVIDDNEDVKVTVIDDNEDVEVTVIDDNEDVEITVIDDNEEDINKQSNSKNDTTGSSEKKYLNQKQMKEKQQKFAMLHFLFFGLNDFLGIEPEKKPDEEV
ncbi:hypothetical protein [Sporomusa aerivorans]|uniref:hypothetical protein n=1 Tax=Sporomusa aerivorans TaxID=204936 RepID=UPI00352B923A